MKIDQLPVAPAPTSTSEARDLELKGTDTKHEMKLKRQIVVCSEDPRSAENLENNFAPNLSLEIIYRKLEKAKDRFT